jgi:hypothetical protein
VNRRQASADDSHAPAEHSSRSGQVDITGVDTGEELIDAHTMRKVELARRRALGKHAAPGDPQTLFDWGL